MSNINDRLKKQHEQITKYEKIIQEKSQLICEYKDKVDFLRKIHEDKITELKVSKDNAYHILYVEKEKNKSKVNKLECKNKILKHHNVNLEIQIRKLQEKIIENNINRVNNDDNDDYMTNLPYVIMIFLMLIKIGSIYNLIYTIIHSMFLYIVSLILTLIYLFYQKDIHNIHVLGITLSKHKPYILYSHKR